MNGNEKLDTVLLGCPTRKDLEGLRVTWGAFGYSRLEDLDKLSPAGLPRTFSSDRVALEDGCTLALVVRSAPLASKVRRRKEARGCRAVPCVHAVRGCARPFLICAAAEAAAAACAMAVGRRWMRFSGSQIIWRPAEGMPAGGCAFESCKRRATRTPSRSASRGSRNARARRWSRSTVHCQRLPCRGRVQGRAGRYLRSAAAWGITPDPVGVKIVYAWLTV